ncbi:MAG: hypothetical protein K2P51_08345 [Rhabdochlamydiaceae bacterium]|nr:hypothetical protein [Rhabdochlamydiaceae bacterium]
MPKVDPNYLKNAVLECRQKIKQKGRDTQGRSYLSSPEQRMLTAFIEETFDEGKAVLNKIAVSGDPKNLELLIDRLKPLIAYDLQHRNPEVSAEQIEKKAESFTTNLARNYSDTCYHYKKIIDPKIEELFWIRDKFICCKEPLTYSEKRNIRELRSKTLPLCHRLISVWKQFNESIHWSQQAMREGKPIDRLTIVRFNDLVQQEARKIWEH